MRNVRNLSQKFTGKDPHYIKDYTFDPNILKGNIEGFAGVAQVPLGFAEAAAD